MKKLALLPLVLLAACSADATNSGNAPSNKLSEGRPDIFGKKSEVNKPAGEGIKLNPSWLEFGTGEQVADQVSFTKKGRPCTTTDAQAAIIEYASSKADGLPGVNAEGISENPVVLRMRPQASAQQAMAFIEMMARAKVAPFYFVIEGETERILKLRLPVDDGLTFVPEPPPPMHPPDEDVEITREEPTPADPDDGRITEVPDTDDDRKPDRPELHLPQPRVPREIISIIPAIDGDTVAFSLGLDARRGMPATTITRSNLVKNDTVQDAAYNAARKELADKLVDLYGKIRFDRVEVVAGSSWNKALNCAELVLMIDAARLAGNIVHPEKTDPWMITFKFVDVLKRHDD